MGVDIELKSFSFHRADVYSFRFNHYGWAIFTVCNDTGELSIQSDWGDWSYRWSHAGIGEGRTLAGFLAIADKHYLSRKLMPDEQRKVPDYESTLESLREVILEKRRSDSIDKCWAREMWNEAEDFASAYDQAGIIYGFDAACRAVSSDFVAEIDELWELLGTKDSHTYIILRDHLLPVFKQHLRPKDQNMDMAAYFKLKKFLGKDHISILNTLRDDGLLVMKDWSDLTSDKAAKVERVIREFKTKLEEALSESD